MNLNSKDKSLGDVHESINPAAARSPWKKIFAFLGPAYLVSVGYMDPGNWATDIAGGSQFGYKLIWVLLMSNLMALLLQSLSAQDRKSTRLNSSHSQISYAVFCLKKKK